MHPLLRGSILPINTLLAHNVCSQMPPVIQFAIESGDPDNGANEKGSVGEGEKERKRESES